MTTISVGIRFARDDWARYSAAAQARSLPLGAYLRELIDERDQRANALAEIRALLERRLGEKGVSSAAQGAIQQGRGAMAPIATQERVRAKLASTHLGEGQRAAVELIATSKNQMVGVQGYAGTGKSHMLREAKALAEEGGYSVVALAPYSGAGTDTRAARGGVANARLLPGSAGEAPGRPDGPRHRRGRYRTRPPDGAGAPAGQGAWRTSGSRRRYGTDEGHRGRGGHSSSSSRRAWRPR